MENTPKFNIHQPPDPQTGQVDRVWIEMDPQDGGNFQTHCIVRLTFNPANNNWKVEKQTWVEVSGMSPKPDLESAIKAGIKVLTDEWCGV